MKQSLSHVFLVHKCDVYHRTQSSQAIKVTKKKQRLECEWGGVNILILSEIMLYQHSFIILILIVIIPSSSVFSALLEFLYFFFYFSESSVSETGPTCVGMDTVDLTVIKAPVNDQQLCPRWYWQLCVRVVGNGNRSCLSGQEVVLLQGLLFQSAVNI